jgi:hypothetical protein
MESQAPNRTEGELIAGILAGETQLYHELIRPHERSVYLLALSYVQNEADAEDGHRRRSFRLSGILLRFVQSRNLVPGSSVSP